MIEFSIGFLLLDSIHGWYVCAILVQRYNLFRFLAEKNMRGVPNGMGKPQREGEQCSQNERNTKRAQKKETAHAEREPPRLI